MIDYEQQRFKYYRERIGKVYGCWRVIDVWHDESNYGQRWKVQCVHCGKVKEISCGNDLVKGRGTGCKCQKVRVPKIKPKAPTYEEKLSVHYGEIHNGWKIIKYEANKGLLCECQNCGRTSYKQAKKVIEDRVEKCICSIVPTVKYDTTYLGNRYGHLTVIGVKHRKIADHNRIVFECVCDCGKVIYDRPVFLERGMKLCCGSDCPYKNDTIKLEEGSSKERLYQKWRGMKDRCNNPLNSHYKSYGKRGIKVCDEWNNDYVAFRRWALANGYKEGLTIDRINPDGNYEPNNCRFITLQENSSRARHTTFTVESNYTQKRLTKYRDIQVVVDGYVVDIHTACALKGTSMQTIIYRVNKMGMTWQEAIDEKIEKGRPKKSLVDKFSKDL